MARMARHKSHRKARTRQALIDAAVRLIAEGRGDRAGIQEITEKADIGFGSFYNHFDSRAIVQFGGHLIKVTLRDRLEVGAAGHTGIIGRCAAAAASCASAVPIGSAVAVMVSSSSDGTSVLSETYTVVLSFPRQRPAEPASWE
jgi:AcrR family transcriptional regulator